MRKMITALAAAGILLFAACSGDDDDTTGAGQDTDGAETEGAGDSGGESNAADSGGGGNSSDFCTGAAAIFQPTGDVDPQGQLEQAQSLEPPAEIAEDWNTLIEGSLAAQEASANLDPNDPEAAAEFQEQYQGLMEASTSVYTYLGEECGVEGFTPPVTEPTATTTGG